MSFGLSKTIAGNYPQADGRTQLKALTDAGIIAVAAASNEGSSSGGSSLFTTGVSPGSVPGVLSVASVENTAQPGSLLHLDTEIDTSTGPRSILGESRTCAKSVLCLRCLQHAHTADVLQDLVHSVMNQLATAAVALIQVWYRLICMQPRIIIVFRAEVNPPSPAHAKAAAAALPLVMHERSGTSPLLFTADIPCERVPPLLP
jgi:hypothetical protein